MMISSALYSQCMDTLGKSTVFSPGLEVQRNNRHNFWKPSIEIPIPPIDDESPPLSRMGSFLW